jgi:hypothetical protein
MRPPARTNRASMKTGKKNKKKYTHSSVLFLHPTTHISKTPKSQFCVFIEPQMDHDHNEERERKRHRDSEPPFDADRAGITDVSKAEEGALAELRKLRLHASRRADFRACRKLIEQYLGERFPKMPDADVLDMSIVGLATYCSEGDPRAAAKAAALVALKTKTFLTDNAIRTPADTVLVSQPLCCTFNIPGARMSIDTAPDALLASIMNVKTPTRVDVAFQERVARERQRRRKALCAARSAIFALTGATATDDQVHEQIVDLAADLLPGDVPGLRFAIVKAILDVRACIQQIAPCTTATQLAERVGELTIGQLCSLRVDDCTAYTSDSGDTDSD